MQNYLSQALHVIGQSVLIPCLIILILLIIAALIEAGDILFEGLKERKKYQKDITGLILKIQDAGKQEESDRISSICSLIEESNLLPRQKRAINEVFESVETGACKASVVALAARIISYEEEYYDKQISVTNLIAKLGPMFGLLGTLIPLGPGIIALGNGDTATLASSIGVAFDTTIAGLLAAGIAIVISGIRKRWYSNYMDSLDTLLECIIEEVVKND